MWGGGGGGGGTSTPGRRHRDLVLMGAEGACERAFFVFFVWVSRVGGADDLSRFCPACRGCLNEGLPSRVLKNREGIPKLLGGTRRECKRPVYLIICHLPLHRHRCFSLYKSGAQTGCARRHGVKLSPFLSPKFLAAAVVRIHGHALFSKCPSALHRSTYIHWRIIISRTTFAIDCRDNP